MCYTYRVAVLPALCAVAAFHILDLAAFATDVVVDTLGTTKAGRVSQDRGRANTLELVACSRSFHGDGKSASEAARTRGSIVLKAP